MGSLRDELLKAKIITKKQAKKAKLKDRLEKKKLSLDEIEVTKRRKQEEFERSRLETAEINRKQAKKDKTNQSEKERVSRLRNIILNAEIFKDVHGPRRFYFIASDSKIPCKEISVGISKDLEQGNAAIVETPGETREVFRIITREGAMKLQQEGNEFIRFFNR